MDPVSHRILSCEWDVNSEADRSECSTLLAGEAVHPDGQLFRAGVKVGAWAIGIYYRWARYQWVRVAY